MKKLFDISDLRSGVAWNATLAEFIATSLFVFVGAGAVVTLGMVDGETMTVDRLTAIALAHGLAIAVLVAATARISGGHLNPAVTIASVITGEIGVVKGVMYVTAQLVGAAIAALLLSTVMPADAQGSLGVHTMTVRPQAGLLIETVLTFILVLVIFGTAIDARGPGHLAPFAIGAAVIIDGLVGIPLTGASMNPARSFGPALVAGEWASHWVYWVGPILGGAIAAVLYKVAFMRHGNHVLSS